MIYFNQAATTWPKPEGVQLALQEAITKPPVPQGRSGAVDCNTDIAVQCKQKLALLFHIEDMSRIYFTSGATDSFNRIIRGLYLVEKQVVVTQNEHNAVLRPLYNICIDSEITVVSCDSCGHLILSELEEKITPDTKAVFVNHCSNVTGAVADLERIGKIVHRNHALLIVDASQSAGHLEIDVVRMGIDILVFTGHKGLFGPQGTGGFYVRPGVYLQPSVYGGTGYDSKRLIMREDSEEYEVGTQNLHGIQGLCAGVDFILKKGIERIQVQEYVRMETLRQGLAGMKHVIVYGDERCKGSVLSFSIKGISPQDIAYILANSYGIVVRSGFHCAPLIHQALGTEKEGTVRVSLSCFNTMEEIRYFLSVIKELEQCV